MKSGYNRWGHALCAAALGTLLAGALGAQNAGEVQEEVVRADMIRYTPHRVAKGKSFKDFEYMLQELSRADVVFLGEQHDDAGTHALQLAVLEGLDRNGVKAVLSLEMFERDVQGVLDDYLAGKISETEFLAKSRPWPNHGSDYKPMLEFAKAKGWPVIASNIPRPLASAVSRGSLSVIDTLSPETRSLLASELRCSQSDKYAKKFLKTMEDMGSHGSAAMPADMIGRFYEAQCVKDETMAESIVNAARSYPGSLIVHVAGSFHVEEGLGTVERVKWREKDSQEPQKLSKLPVVVFRPTPSFQELDAGRDRKLGDWIVYTLREK